MPTTIPELRNRCDELIAFPLLNSEHDKLPRIYQERFLQFRNIRRTFEKTRNIDIEYGLRQKHFQALDLFSSQLLNCLINLEKSVNQDAGIQNQYLIDFNALMLNSYDELLPEMALMLIYASKNETEDATAMIATIKQCEVDALVMRDTLRDGMTDKFLISNADNFLDEALAQRASAVQWRRWGVYFACALLAYGIWVNVDVQLHHTAVVADIVRNGLAHASIVGIMVYAMSICFRNHSTHNHNDVIYRRQYNSLKTFKYIVDAAPDDATKGAILQTLATSVFTVQDSGYLANGGDTIQISAVADAIKGAVK